MANKSLTTRQKMVFRGKPKTLLSAPGQTRAPRAKRKPAFPVTPRAPKPLV